MLQSLRKIIFLLRYHLFHKHKLSRTVKEKVNGIEFLVYPSVFNPVSYYSSKLFADFVSALNDLEGKRVLDMGCGTGIIGIFAALKGANVTAADKNPEAVKCTTENAKRNNVSSKLIAYEGDLFQPINVPSPSERGAGVRFFDIIFFNPPYYSKEPKTDFELGFNAGKDLRVIDDFAAAGKAYLNENGIIYLIVSSDVGDTNYPPLTKGGVGGLDALINIFNRNAFTHKFVTTKRKLFETFYIMEMTM
ncbi:MAG: methyltransferase [Thermodesulfobacteriota bacterium]